MVQPPQSADLIIMEPVCVFTKTVRQPEFTEDLWHVLQDAQNKTTCQAGVPVDLLFQCCFLFAVNL